MFYIDLTKNHNINKYYKQVVVDIKLFTHYYNSLQDIIVFVLSMLHVGTLLLTATTQCVLAVLGFGRFGRFRFQVNLCRLGHMGLKIVEIENTSPSTVLFYYEYF